jgi:hypothetical protein
VQGDFFFAFYFFSKALTPFIHLIATYLYERVFLFLLERVVVEGGKVQNGAD